MKADVRERSHELMRSDLANRAVDLLVHFGGYDGLTTDGLAQQLGISRATFFRYLGSKDDAVVAAMLGPVDQFAVTPAVGKHPSASLWLTVRGAFDSVVSVSGESSVRIRERIQLVQTQPTLGARLRRARAPQIELLAASLVDLGVDGLAAQTLSTAAVAVFDQCLARWARDDQIDLRQLLDQAFRDLDAASQPLITPVAPPALPR